MNLEHNYITACLKIVFTCQGFGSMHCLNKLYLLDDASWMHMTLPQSYVHNTLKPISFLIPQVGSNVKDLSETYQCLNILWKISIVTSLSLLTEHYESHTVNPVDAYVGILGQACPLTTAIDNRLSVTHGPSLLQFSVIRFKDGSGFGITILVVRSAQWAG